MWWMLNGDTFIKNQITPVWVYFWFFYSIGPYAGNAFYYYGFAVYFKCNTVCSKSLLIQSLWYFHVNFGIFLLNTVIRISMGIYVLISLDSEKNVKGSNSLLYQLYYGCYQILDTNNLNEDYFVLAGDFWCLSPYSQIHWLCNCGKRNSLQHVEEATHLVTGRKHSGAMRSRQKNVTMDLYTFKVMHPPMTHPPMTHPLATSGPPQVSRPSQLWHQLVNTWNLWGDLLYSNHDTLMPTAPMELRT